MRFEDAAQHLYVDGSWRDIYALNASGAELNRYMAFIRPLLREDSFQVGGEVVSMPLTYKKARDHSSDFLKFVSIPVGTGYLNCHFFCEDELELDFRPQDYNSPEQWIHLDEFLQELSGAMRRELIVTPENQSDIILIKYTDGEKGSSSLCVERWA